MTDGDQGREIVVVVVGGCWSYLKTPRLTIRWNFFWCGQPRRAASPRLASPTLLTRFGRSPPDFLRGRTVLGILDCHPDSTRMIGVLCYLCIYVKFHSYCLVVGSLAAGVLRLRLCFYSLRPTARTVLFFPGTSYFQVSSLPYTLVTSLHAE